MSKATKADAGEIAVPEGYSASHHHRRGKELVPSLVDANVLIPKPTVANVKRALVEYLEKVLG